MTAIREQINTIISNRQQYQTEFNDYYKKIKTIKDFVLSVKAFESNSGWLAVISKNEKLKNEWERIISEIKELEIKLNCLCNGDSGILMECLKRVNREYLNIGCVGPWRQGKSTVISKLTNLSDYVIPRSKFLTCTGTTINIFNGNQVVWENGKYVELDGNKAVVYYHSFNSICKAINDYLKELKLDAMPYANTKDSFVKNCNSCFNKNIGKPCSDSKLKKMLDTYLQHASEYVDLLKPDEGMYDEILNLSSTESQQKLRPLISYYEFTDAEYEEKGIQIPSQVFYVLAVKKVDVYTTFLINGKEGPEEVGKIQFVDTPGLGESKLEVAETLANSLRSELDIAICLRKVSNQAGIIPNDSYDFHKVLKQNTYGRKPENWVFYLYNKEGNVAEDILRTTFEDVNNDLANTQEEGLKPGQVVGGIKLKYDLTNPSGNHIDFIDAENESDKLQDFFMSILKEMANTISDSDNAFYKETRSLYNEVANTYSNILKQSFWNISKCLPTFDDREKILNVIKGINESWLHKVHCPETLNESINKAMSKFYMDPYGAILAEVFGISHDKINEMKQSIEDIEKKKEIGVAVKIRNREKIAKDLLLPYIQTNINQNVIMSQQVLAKFQEWKSELSQLMVERATSYIKDSNIIEEIENVKTVIWKSMMTDGHLAFNQTDVNSWVLYFLAILDEGGADFSSLREAIFNFYNYKFDLEGKIKSIVKTKIDQIAQDYQILQGDISNIHDVIFKSLYDAERETKAQIQKECKDVVNSQLSIELSNFNNQIGTFEMTIIPAHDHILNYKVEFEQLIKFYNKYSSDIFTQDEQANQKLAVKEWNILKLKYIN